MGQIIFKIWYLIAILPFLILIEGNKKFADFLRRKNIYLGWNILHSIVVVLIILVITLWLNGYR